MMKQNATTELLLAAMMAATPARKEDALLVLRGEASVADGNSGSGPGARKGLEPYVGVRDVAAFLNVSARSVKRWQVPEHKLGGRTRFRLSEVARYMESEGFRARLEELREGREVGRSVRSGQWAVGSETGEMARAEAQGRRGERA